MLSWMRWIRVLGFAAVYFFLSVTSVVIFTIRSYSGSSSELKWYLQNPWNTLHAIFGELVQSLHLMLQLLVMIFYSFIYGFITDWVFLFLKGRILLRKREQRRGFDHPKT